MLAFPNFYGRKHKNASYFLDDLEMALLAFGQNENEVKLRAFPLVLKDEAKIWFQGLTARQKADWATLKESFLTKYVTDNTPKKVWQKLTCLQQDNLASYLAYEAQFMKLWMEWKAGLGEGERAPNFLQKERFLAGLNTLLQEKVRAKFPETFEEAR